MSECAKQSVASAHLQHLHVDRNQTFGLFIHMVSIVNRLILNIISVPIFIVESPRLTV